MPSPIPKFLATVSDKEDAENGPMYVSPGTGFFSFAGDARTGKVGLWDLKSGESMVQHQLKDDDRPSCVATAHDACKGAFGTASGEIFIWDVCFPAVLESFSSGPPDAVTSLSWHPRGHVLAAGNASGKLTVWDMILGSPAFQTSHGAEITGLKWSGHGRQLISIGTDNELKLWNTRRAEVSAIIDGSADKTPDSWHTGGITCIDTLPDMSRVALTGGADGTAFLSVLKPNEKEGIGPFCSLPKHTDAVSAVVMGPLECKKPLRCATGGKDKSIKLFDMEMKLQMGMFVHKGDDGVSQLEFNHNGDVLFSSAGNSVVAWDSRAVKEEEPEVTFETDSPVSSFCIANDGASIIIGCDDSKLRCFDVRYPTGDFSGVGMPNLNSLTI